MKELLFCYKENRKLRIRHRILTDAFVPTEDVISPQKSTLTLPKTNKIQLNDIVVIRDNNSGHIEYLGYIDTLTNKTVTEISCYPIVNVFDNDYVLDQLFQKTTKEDGSTVDTEVDASQWLVTQLQRAFIETEDDLQALPLIIRNKTKQPVFYKKVLDTANLLEAYIDLFVEKGLYVSFSGLSYNGYEIDGIYCDILSNREEKPYSLRYDNPSVQSVDIVDNTFTNYNKIIATQELEEGSTAQPQRYFFYLLDNNEITREQDDAVRVQEEAQILQQEGRVVYLGRRIKQVRSKEITFTMEGESEEENAKALLLAVYNELQAPEYNLQITVSMFKNEQLRLYRRVDFLAESGIMYSSNITKLERLNEKQVRVTLGALRNSLTDFKKKVEAI